MNRRNIVVYGSVAVFLPAAYFGLVVLCGFAVAALFYELGKLSGSIDRTLRSGDEDSVSPIPPQLPQMTGNETQGSGF